LRPPRPDAVGQSARRAPQAGAAGADRRPGADGAGLVQSPPPSLRRDVRDRAGRWWNRAYGLPGVRTRANRARAAAHARSEPGRLVGGGARRALAPVSVARGGISLAREQGPADLPGARARSGTR